MILATVDHSVDSQVFMIKVDLIGAAHSKKWLCKLMVFAHTNINTEGTQLIWYKYWLTKNLFEMIGCIEMTSLIHRSC